MVPARKIAPPAWMTDQKAVLLMRVLGGFEIPAKSLFVGGCVRNTLMGVPVHDVDIATLYHPHEVIEKLKAAGIRHIPTGLDHGTVTALVDEATFEITTLRKDVETDGRRAVVAFTSDWREDAARRDFTMNTLLASPEGMVFDPIGHGLADLDARRVAFAGNPAERIAEDSLRILRFFRFYAYYGQGVPDQAALNACKKQAAKISTLSRERVTQELFKILAAPQTSKILDLMFSHGVLKFMAKGYKPAVMDNLCSLQDRYEARDILARLFVLSGLKISFFEDRLSLSNAQKRWLESLSAGLAVLKSLSKKKMRELVYRVGNDVATQVYFLKLAKADELPNLEILDIARYWQAPEFPVTGEDLIAAGISPGPVLGKKLKAMEETWIGEDFPEAFNRA